MLRVLVLLSISAFSYHLFAADTVIYQDFDIANFSVECRPLQISDISFYLEIKLADGQLLKLPNGWGQIYYHADDCEKKASELHHKVLMTALSRCRYIDLIAEGVPDVWETSYAPLKSLKVTRSALCSPEP